MESEILSLIRDSGERMRNAQREIDRLGFGVRIEASKQSSGLDSTIAKSQIYQGLMKISEPLGNSYAQIRLDLAKSDERLSWAGTAHEIRQIVSTLLQILAPDEKVEKQPGYKREANTSGPTQKQRVTFILRQRNEGSQVTTLAEKAAKLDDMIADVVRDFYSRASDAAHRFKGPREVNKLLRYFDAFAHDLLDLE